MAKIRSGVLGNTRGKVAGVVGSQWKDVNYIREFVKPANPDTAAQQAQRNKMRLTVAFGKPLVGPIFNAYTDKFQKSMSGFNAFIKQNIDIFAGAIAYEDILISTGKLHAPVSSAAVYNSGTGACVFTVDTGLGNNGADDDSLFAAVYDKDSKLWYFAAAEVDRSTGTITVTCDTGLTATDLQTYVLAAQYSGTIVSMISTSIYDEAEAA